MRIRTKYIPAEDEIILVGFGHRLSDEQIRRNLLAAGYARSLDSVHRRRVGGLRLLHPQQEIKGRGPSTRKPKDQLYQADAKFALAMLAARTTGTGSERDLILGVVKDHRPMKLVTIHRPETYVPRIWAMGE